MSDDSLQFIPSSVESVRQRIQAAAAFSGRGASEIQLLPVTKGQDESKLRALHALGFREFGENYTQELLSKNAALSDIQPRWHYIGALQSNKIDRIVQVASIIQTVGRIDHARAIAKAAAKHGKSPFPIYVQVNIDDEEQKGGVRFSHLEAFLAELQQIPGLSLLGLMAIPSASYQDGVTPSVPDTYLRLRRYSDRAGAKKMSLGMSGDLVLAIQAGSTCVRIGRALLGERS